MFSARPGGAWSQEAVHERAAVGGRTASDAVRPSMSKKGLALRKKNERARTTALWTTLELLTPSVDQNRGHPGYRSKALRGRAKEELLKDIMHAVRLARPELLGGLVAPGALEQAYTTQAGGGLIGIELKSGKIAYQSPSFQELTHWVPAEARGNIRVSLESRDGDDFHNFCQSVVRDAGESYGETFRELDKVVGRSITVRFLTRAPGPVGLRNPEWLLMVRAVKLTLVGVQPQRLAGNGGESPAAGRTMPFFGQRAIPEAIGVFTADLSGGMPQQWTVQAAHVRNLLDLGVASGTYDIEVGNMKPLEQIAMLYTFECSQEEGAGASMFSRAAAQLEYAATSALTIAQRSASWLTRKALRITDQWSSSLNDDDTVSISHPTLFTLFGGLSFSVSVDYVGGKVGFSHGGLDALYFVADPGRPLDGNLRATWVRIASSTERGGFDVHRPFVVSLTWSPEQFHFSCKMLHVDHVGKKMPSVEDVSQLLERLKVSPGGGHLSDGSATICVGQSHV